MAKWCMYSSIQHVIYGQHTDTQNARSVFTRSFVVPTTTLLASRLSNTSSVLSWPAAPGRGGKLERPSSKLGDGGLGGGGGDWGVTLYMMSTNTESAQNLAAEGNNLETQSQSTATERVSQMTGRLPTDHSEINTMTHLCIITLQNKSNLAFIDWSFDHFYI